MGRSLGRDARLLLAVSGMLAVSFFGVQMLLKVLYVLRLGYGLEFVGWFNAASAFTYMGMGLPSGALGNRYGTRAIMGVGSLAIVAGMCLLPLAEQVMGATPCAAQGAWLIGAHMVLTAGWSMFNVNLAPALMAATTAQERGSAYALNGALTGLGSLLGTVFGGMLPDWFARWLGQTLDDPSPYRLGLWVSAVLSVAAIVPLIWVRSAAAVATTGEARPHSPFPLLPVAWMMLYIYLRHAGWATCQAFYNAYLDTDLCLPVSTIGLITGVGQFAAMIASLLTPRLAARRSHGWMLIMTTLGIAVSLILLAWPHWTAASGGVWGVLVLSAVWMPALQSFQMEFVSAEWRTLAYGAVSMAMGLGFGSISLGGGYMAAAWGYRSLFLLGAGLSVAGAAVMWGITRRFGPPTHNV